MRVYPFVIQYDSHYIITGKENSSWKNPQINSLIYLLPLHAEGIKKTAGSWVEQPTGNTGNTKNTMLVLCEHANKPLQTA